MSIPVVFPGCTAVTSADFHCGSIIAVNSFDCVIRNTTEKCNITANRPYGFIASNGGELLALGGNCGNKVYILNGDFEEVASICIRTQNGPLLSVYGAGCGKLLLTYRKRIVLAERDGSTTQTLAEMTDDEKDFLSALPTPVGMLLAYGDGNRDNLRLCGCGGAVGNCTLPEGVTFKGFAVGGDGTVFCLYANGYPYRYLAPVLTDGVLCCDFASFSRLSFFNGGTEFF